MEKAEFISAIEKNSVDLCNGDLAKFIERFKDSEEIIAKMI